MVLSGGTWGEMRKGGAISIKRYSRKVHARGAILALLFNVQSSFLSVIFSTSVGDACKLRHTVCVFWISGSPPEQLWNSLVELDDGP